MLSSLASLVLAAPIKKCTASTMLPLIETWLASDLTQKQFCKQHNLTFWSLQYWLKRYGRPKMAHPKARAKWNACFSADQSD